jgi:predicted nucleotidyltransferase
MELEKLLQKAQAELKLCFGDNLESVLVYGSAAIDDFVPGVSDINLLVVLKRVNIYMLDSVRDFMKKMGRAFATAPLVLTREHIRTSADVFPIEFLEIKEKHRMLLGDDLFIDLVIDNKNLRHECEHELKGRIIRIRQSFMEAKGSSHELKELLISAHAANFPAFRAALRLKEVVPPMKKEEVTAALSVNFDLDVELFHTIKRLRMHEIKLDAKILRDLIGKYLVEVEKLAAIVDRL